MMMKLHINIKYKTIISINVPITVTLINNTNQDF